MDHGDSGGTTEKGWKLLPEYIIHIVKMGNEELFEELQKLNPTDRIKARIKTSTTTVLFIW